LNYAKKTIFPKTFRPVGFAYTFYTHTHFHSGVSHEGGGVGILTAGTGNRRREFLYVCKAVEVSAKGDQPQPQKPGLEDKTCLASCPTAELEERSGET
jgi:hypothetical protein